MKNMVFNGKLIKVYSVNNKDLVIHPGASVVIPLISKDNIILVKQYRFAIKKWTWEVPAGTLKSEESPLRCAKRELEEETGYKAGKLTKLLSFYSSPGFLFEKMHLFLATDLKIGVLNLDEDENIKIKVFNLKEIEKMIFENKIVDAKTLVAILFLKNFLK
ncbi:MAG: NUDIX hydrolase [Candidatus Firestonebacteria bacterium]